MNSAGSFFVRYRVRLGYPLAIAVLFFARPQPGSIFYGALLGVIGLGLRAWAAGYLHKQEVLTVTGPYAYTRNPLYLGSAILAGGVAIAARSWISALILVAYFSIFYSVVIAKEEAELRPRHRDFEGYATEVPQFFPGLRLRACKAAAKALFHCRNIRRIMNGKRALVLCCCYRFWF